MSDPVLAPTAVNALTRAAALASASAEGPDIGPTQAWTIAKGVFSFSKRMAALQQKYPNEPIPADVYLLTALGLQDEPNPLAAMNSKLDLIGQKLDWMKTALEDIQLGLKAVGEAAAYSDIKDASLIIQHYVEALPAHLDPESDITPGDRGKFLDKLLGTNSEWDSVTFLAEKILDLTPQGTSQVFNLLFTFLARGATPDNGMERFTQGAFMFRYVIDLLTKALLLELYAAQGRGNPATLTARVDAVTNKYKNWFLLLIDTSLMPFAEGLATLRFQQEYFGGNSVETDSIVPFQQCQPPSLSILRSADRLAGKAMGSARGVTLRIILKTPPIVKTVPASPPDNGGVFAGHFEWSYVEGPAPKLDVDRLRDQIIRQASKELILQVTNPLALPGNLTPQRINEGKISALPGAKLPWGYNQTTTILRLAYNLSDEMAQRYGIDRVEKPVFYFELRRPLSNYYKPSSITWDRIWIEDRKRSQWERKTFQIFPLGSQEPWGFELASDGQLSPVLIVGAYEHFGQQRI